MTIAGRISPSTNKRPSLQTNVKTEIQIRKTIVRTTTCEGTQTELQKIRLLKYFAVLKDIRHGYGVDG